MRDRTHCEVEILVALIKRRRVLQARTTRRCVRACRILALATSCCILYVKPGPPFTCPDEDRDSDDQLPLRTCPVSEDERYCMVGSWRPAGRRPIRQRQIQCCNLATLFSSRTNTYACIDLLYGDGAVYMLLSPSSILLYCTRYDTCSYRITLDFQR
jgi:hypothetical protein